ncbi:leucyl aminopeptidase family protein [Spirilliplanes yamanashiensis]|uniref:leucyl aminopeptidase family protein n=1 Tax=Spirilliplanes yamanashiensis TaxID=42233 RepID=UPI00351FD241
MVLPVGAGGDLAARAPQDVLAEAAELLRDADDPGRPGAVQVLPRPLRTPARVLLAGVGAGDAAGWRAAGAAITAAARAGEALRVAAHDLHPDGVRAFAEAAWLAGYAFRAPGDADDPAQPYGDDTNPAEILLVGAPEAGLAEARATAAATALARDWVNMPSSVKNPEWLAGRFAAEAAGRPGLTARVLAGDELAGFGGILAVGGGSVSPPRLVELSWSPANATTHVVLVGKGITFDTGGISIKPVAAMTLMRKDMGGAAAVAAATLAAADLRLPVRVTTLLPLAENAVSGAAMRPGDVITHFDGTTSESTNTDAEGRLVLADALGYAAARLDPDVIVDLATLTGANAVALGKRTAALYSQDDELAAALEGAAAAAGEQVWRMPLPEDYVPYLRSDIADRFSAPAQGAGSVVAALYLREFVGDTAQWAHLDMSAPSWADAADGELTKGATGWGVRTLVRWLSAIA